MPHLGNPCIHCGERPDLYGGHDKQCDKDTGAAAALRAITYLSVAKKRHEDESRAVRDNFTSKIAHYQTLLNQEVSGLDSNKIQLAENFLDVTDYSKGGQDAPLAVRDAILWFATGKAGYRGLRYEYFGTKSYDRWHGQRCDCKYGMGPTHGHIIFRVGLGHGYRDHNFSEEEKNAAIYYLSNLEAIQAAKCETEE